MIRTRSLAAAFAALLALAPSARADPLALRVGWLEARAARPPVLSNLDPAPEDLGLAGARLGLADNAASGRFLGQRFALSEVVIPPGEDPLAPARALLSETGLLVVSAPAATLTAIADLPEAEGALIFNAAAPEADLRGAGCRANVLHVFPSLAMRADALMQFLAARRWTELAMIEGTHEGDAEWAGALAAAARKFGLRIRGREVWDHASADIRRLAGQEAPLFTQNLPAHDVLLVADEQGDFARWMMFNTWEPRLFAGSEGLVPSAWTPQAEQWGASQLQSRFRALAGRDMRPEDYAAWAALRAVGEAATRAVSAEPGRLRAYMLGPEFELAGFKGRPLSFRAWNGQLRQPIPLAHPRGLVAMAPLEGFLHQRNEMDTLGQDAPESACRAFEGGNG
ncbi:ABC transporter, substrate binding protein, PQQ-dependent alcohol dehydrogenase system [Albimonas donghaensis]|uniref:ABC transporter, substrate binding protein, PQQ-dependent alcohol dehydrogenase system n=1 Tax=Albimonas donghaensis TaxID=356660 RepID=A0A1H2TYS4_9RHOB|nr:ABC transporter substrate-binding protein [Albimonas donghaensis]SDW48459.1 ABC transporter, substrate binding protein, PQQ-dependent alcohol dehydrogenase system [Albimonas donghaensis]